MSGPIDINGDRRGVLEFHDSGFRSDSVLPAAGSASEHGLRRFSNAVYSSLGAAGLVQSTDAPHQVQFVRSPTHPHLDCSCCFTSVGCLFVFVGVCVCVSIDELVLKRLLCVM